MNKTKILMTVMAVAVSLMMTACSSDKSSSGPVGGGVVGPNDCVGCPGYNQSNIYAEAIGFSQYSGQKEMGLTIYRESGSNNYATEGYMFIDSDTGNMCKLLSGEYRVVTITPGQMGSYPKDIKGMELSLRHVSLPEEIIVRTEYMSSHLLDTKGYPIGYDGHEYKHALRAKLQVLDVISGDARRDRDCRDYLSYGSISLEFSPPQTAY